MCIYNAFSSAMTVAHINSQLTQSKQTGETSVPNMLLMPTAVAICWLFVVSLLGPRATWHFVAKPFRFSNTR